MPNEQAGYSGTPLARKLGVVAGSRVVVLHGPEDYQRWLAPLPPDVDFKQRVTAKTDLIHTFHSERKKLAAELTKLRHAIKADGVIWVSWPKKSSHFATDITEDTIRDVALPLGLVDVKVCAVSEVWSGLKLVIRRELR